MIMLDGGWAFFLCFRSFFGPPCFRYLVSTLEVQSWGPRSEVIRTFFFDSFNASHFSVNDGLDKEDDLRFELKAWQLTRQKVGQKIRKKVWDDMDVKGRSINGMQVSKK